MRAPDPATKTNGIVAVRLKVLLVKRNIVARHRQQNVAGAGTRFLRLAQLCALRDLEDAQSPVQFRSQEL